MALKVYRTQIGFYDAIVATNSQPHALQLWGVKQDLFKNGSAEQTKEKSVIEAAMEAPQTPLYRPVGSHDAFVENPKLSSAQAQAAMKKKR